MNKFATEGVTPDVIDKVPTQKLNLTYGGICVEPGVVLTPTQVQDVPSVSWEADESAYYTLIMNDPDAPSRADPKFGEWHHWLVTNIPGSKVTEGDVMSEYVGAGPPEGSSLHRYVFIVFKQSAGKQTFEGLPKLTNRSMDGRPKQKMREFAAKYNLGNPIAGNFFLAEYDSYVPLLYKQLSG